MDTCLPGVLFGTSPRLPGFLSTRSMEKGNESMFFLENPSEKNKIADFSNETKCNVKDKETQSERQPYHLIGRGHCLWHAFSIGRVTVSSCSRRRNWRVGDSSYVYEAPGIAAENQAWQKKRACSEPLHFQSAVGSDDLWTSSRETEKIVHQPSSGQDHHNAVRKYHFIIDWSFNHQILFHLLFFNVLIQLPGPWRPKIRLWIR